MDSNKKKILFFAKVGLASGVYPLVFYYGKNFNLINSWGHLFYFLSLFIATPIFSIVIAGSFMQKIVSPIWTKRAVTFLNFLAFAMYIQLCLLADIKKTITLAILLTSLFVAYFLFRFLKQIMVLQWVLFGLGIIAFLPNLYSYTQVDKTWQQQPDAIEEARFVQKPNIYVIQPDGYANPSELERGYYQIDNSKMDYFLKENDFTVYKDFRSNYDATLSSNSSLFFMKHHYYQDNADNFELYNARNNIVSKNPVLSTLKSNGYRSYFITETPYLLLSKPPMGFDYCNYSYSEIPFISKGFKLKKDVLANLKVHLADPIKEPRFFFVEILNPRHIDGGKKGDSLMLKKRKIYKNNLEETNELLQQMITVIKEVDPNSLIVLLADHGGYVGFDHLQQGNENNTDPEKIISMFSSLLAISWPKEPQVLHENSLKTNVNVFRVLFSYLAKNKEYLKNLEEDASYALINSGAPKGIYKVLDSTGTVVFEKH